MRSAMRRISVIVLVALVRTAAADPADTPKRECKPSGAVLFEVDQRADRKSQTHDRDDATLREWCVEDRGS